MRIALGLEAHLRPFFAEHGASPWWLWPNDNWKTELQRLAADPTTEIYWCLDGLEEEGALELFRQETLRAYSCTGWELVLFCNHREWWDRTTWWLAGQQVRNPLPEEVCV